jgi:ADP-heptose:LPS heptosyltransferase
LAGPIRSPKIAVFRALRLGDMLCAVPALRTLRAGFPGAEITLIGLPWGREFAARFPAFVHDFIPFPGWPGLPEREPDAAAIPAFIERARRRRFDLAIQLHGDGRLTNDVVRQFGATETWGFHPAGTLPPAQGGFVEYPGVGHEIHRLLLLTEAMGLRDRGDALEFPVSAAEESVATSLLSQLGVGPRFAVVHAGGSTPSRRWPPQAFAAVAEDLRARGLPVILTGAAAEAPIVAAVQRGAPSAHPLAGRTSLGVLAALIGRASLLVANDTSVSHIAAALRTHSVIVFSGSEIERWSPLDRDLHHPVPGTPGEWTEGHHREVRSALEEVARVLAGERTHVFA